MGDHERSMGGHERSVGGHGRSMRGLGRSVGGQRGVVSGHREVVEGQWETIATAGKKKEPEINKKTQKLKTCRNLPILCNPWISSAMAMAMSI